jgi:hypothetical protein
MKSPVVEIPSWLNFFGKTQNVFWTRSLPFLWVKPVDNMVQRLMFAEKHPFFMVKTPG